MTVCIAAICAGEYIIGAADRMLTADDIQFQPETSKFFPLTNSIVVMTAGDAGVQAEIVQNVMEDVNARVVNDPDNWWAVSDVADLYYKYFKQARLLRTEGRILAPLGLTVEAYFDKQKTMDSELVRQIATELLKFEIPFTTAICCGIDPSGSHIYVIDNNGISCQDLVGFASIGIGMGHAESQFMFAKHSRLRPAAETLQLVFSAKKRAEVAPGVGEATDMVVLGTQLGRMTTLTEQTLNGLNEIYNEEQEKINEANNQSMERVNKFVEEFSATPAVEKQATGGQDIDGDSPVN